MTTSVLCVVIEGECDRDSSIGGVLFPRLHVFDVLTICKDNVSSLTENIRVISIDESLIADAMVDQLETHAILVHLTLVELNSRKSWN